MEKLSRLLLFGLQARFDRQPLKRFFAAKSSPNAAIRLTGVNSNSVFSPAASSIQ
jgi:hypothetical protein